MKSHRSILYFEITPGVKKTFNDVFDELYVPLCYFSNSILENNELAEDVVQSVFLKLWEQNEKRNKINNIKAYIYRSVHNASIDRLHKEERTVSISKELVQNDNIELRIIEEEVSNELKKVLRLLPKKCKKVFLLSVLNKWSYKQIARELSITENTVKSQRARAIQIIRENYKR